MNPSEHQEQAALMDRVRLYANRYPALQNVAAVPNGGHRNKVTASKLKREGVSPGYPDLIVDVPAGGFHGLRIEMKSLTGFPSREQKQWIERLREHGYRAEVCRGADQAWRLICDYLGIRP